MTERIVFTGGPGSGKSTLLAALAQRGYATMPEAGRNIIRAQRAIGGSALPWADTALYAELMLAWDLRSHAAAETVAGPVFFDRGIPDVLGYLRLLGGPAPAHVHRAATAFAYHRIVFIAPPWPEIFGADGERRQSSGEAVRTYDAMAAVYPELGYELVELPRASVESRVDFVLTRLSR